MGDDRVNRVASTLAIVLVAGTFLGTPVQAHASGGPVSRSGSFSLSAQGTPLDALDQMFGAIGFSPFAGDVLLFAWNASGGTVYFSIHMHGPGGEVQSSLTRTGESAQGNWTVPGNDAYGAFWRNLGPQSVNVTYRYDLVPHSENELVLLAATIGLSAATLGLVFQTVLARRQERRRDRLPPPPPERSG